MALSEVDSVGVVRRSLELLLEAVDFSAAGNIISVERILRTAACQFAHWADWYRGELRGVLAAQVIAHYCVGVGFVLQAIRNTQNDVCGVLGRWVFVLSILAIDVDIIGVLRGAIALEHAFHAVGGAVRLGFDHLRIFGCYGCEVLGWIFLVFNWAKYLVVGCDVVLTLHGLYVKLFIAILGIYDCGIMLWASPIPYQSRKIANLYWIFIVVYLGIVVGYWNVHGFLVFVLVSQKWPLWI